MINMKTIDQFLKKTNQLIDTAYKRGYVAGINDTLSAMGRKHGILGIKTNIGPEKTATAYPRPKLGHNKSKDGK